MVIASLVVAIIALLVALLALRRAQVVERRARRSSLDRATGGPGDLRAAPPDGGRALTRVAVVRYDAFDDIGGQLSSSSAVVADSGHGLVITSIHGRNETRAYVKRVPADDSDDQRAAELSPEERQAVRQAMVDPR